jgi:hypothetical protein
MKLMNFTIAKKLAFMASASGFLTIVLAAVA